MFNINGFFNYVLWNSTAWTQSIYDGIEITHSILVGFIQTVKIYILFSDEERKLTAGSAENNSEFPAGNQTKGISFRTRTH